MDGEIFSLEVLLCLMEEEYLVHLIVLPDSHEFRELTQLEKRYGQTFRIRNISPG